jgi:hypothetical protein
MGRESFQQPLRVGHLGLVTRMPILIRYDWKYPLRFARLAFS